MKKERLNLVILWFSISAYAVYFSFLSILKFTSFSYYDFDLAVHALTVWNIIHGSVCNSILGIPFLGNHMQPILFLTAPLYAVFPHPLTLLLLQSLALALGAFPIYLIAKRRIGLNFALIIALGYLLYPGLAYTNLFEFHPTSFATLFLIFCAYAYDSGKLKLFLFFSVLAMFCQENIPIAIIMFGFMALLERKPLRWILSPIAIGIAYFIPAVILMGYFNQGTIQFFTIYRHLGNSPLDAVFNLLLNPGLFLSFILRNECLVYLFQVFLPLLFLPFAAWVKLLPAAPFLLQHMLSSRFSDLSVAYHYTTEIIPFLFFSAVYAINRLLNIKIINRHIFVFKYALISFILFSAIVRGPYIKEAFHINNEYRRDYLDVYKERFIRKVPHSANVVATFELLPRLTDRKRLYSLHHPYMGFYTLSQKKYYLSEDVQYAVVDFNDSLTFRGFYQPFGYINLQGIFLNHGWKAIDMIDSLVILKKSPEKEEFICSKVDSMPLNLNGAPPKAKPGVSLCVGACLPAGRTSRPPTFRSGRRDKEIVRVEENFSLIGSNFVYRPEQEAIEATFYWKSLKDTGRDVGMFIDLTDNQGRIIRRLFHPICYRIFPTQSWREGEVYKELLRIYIPKEYLRDDIVVRAGFYDYLTGNILDVSVRESSYGMVKIGSLRCGR